MLCLCVLIPLHAYYLITLLSYCFLICVLIPLHAYYLITLLPYCLLMCAYSSACLLPYYPVILLLCLCACAYSPACLLLKRFPGGAKKEFHRDQQMNEVSSLDDNRAFSVSSTEMQKSSGMSFVGRESQFRLGKEDPTATNLSLSKFARSASE